MSDTESIDSKIREIAPSFCVEINWDHDPYATWDRSSSDVGYAGNALCDEDPDDWQVWTTEVSVFCIHRGEKIEESEYMGGTWEREGDNPEITNPTISGYKSGLMKECFYRLLHKLQGDIADSALQNLREQCQAAIDLLYEEQAENYRKKQLDEV